MGPNVQQGIILNVVVGIGGALIGGWLIGPLLGAIILLAIVSLIRRSSTR